MVFLLVFLPSFSFFLVVTFGGGLSSSLCLILVVLPASPWPTLSSLFSTSVSGLVGGLCLVGNWAWWSWWFVGGLGLKNSAMVATLLGFFGMGVLDVIGVGFGWFNW